MPQRDRLRACVARVCGGSEHDGVDFARRGRGVMREREIGEEATRLPVAAITCLPKRVRRLRRILLRADALVVALAEVETALRVAPLARDREELQRRGLVLLHADAFG